MENKRSLFRRCLHKPYGLYNPRNFFGDAKGSKNLIQRLKLEVKLPVHNGCVNSICWNDAGEFILSGSDDQLLCITNGYTHKVLASIHSGHRANIFSAKFLPNTRDRQIVSCSGDGSIMFTEVERPDLYGMNSFDCHFGTAYEIVTVPNDPYSFLSCGEDGTVRWFDLRMKTRCNVEDCIEDILINCRRAVTSLAVNCLIPYHLAVGCSDSTVRLFDRRMLGTRATGNYTGRGIQGMFSRFIAPSLLGKSHRITSLQYSPDGWEVLVSYSSDYVYLFSIKDMEKYDKESPTKAKKFDVEFSNNQNTPPMKRLRLRGDWSDTGPNARPESELQGERSPHVTLMQRMSDMLSRWLEDSSRLRQEGSERRGGRSWQNRQVSNPESIVGSTNQIEDDNQEIDLSVQNINHETLALNIDQSPIVLPMESIPEVLIPINSFPESNHILSTNNSDTGNANSLVENICSQVAENSQTNPIDSENSQPNSPEIHRTIKVSDLLEIIEPLTASDNSIISSEIILQSSSLNEVDTSITNEAAPDTTLPSSSQWTNNSNSIRVDLAKASVADRCIFDIDLPVQQSFDSDLMSFPEKKLDSALELDQKSDNHMEFTSEEATCSLNIEKNLELPFLDSKMEVTLESDLESEQNSLMKMVQNNHVSNKPELISNDPFNVHTSLNYSLESSTPSRAFCDNVEQIESIVSETESVITRVVSTENIVPIVSTDETVASTDVTMISTEDDSTMIRLTEDVATIFASSIEDIAMAASSTEDVTTMVTSTDVTRMVESSPDVTSMVTSSVSQSFNIQASGSTEYTGDILALSERREDRDSLQRRTSDPGQSGSGMPRRSRRFGMNVDFNVEDLTWQSSEEEHNSDDIAPRNRTWRRAPSQQLETPEQERRNNAARQIQEIFRKREKEKEDLELMSIPQPSVKISFSGHRNARTMIREANFWGEHFVMSGSDCGHIFIWDRHTAELVMIMEADQHVVNCLQPHPFDPVLATSGIDYDIKLWSPLAEEPNFDKDLSLEIIRRNEIMLEETRDTITVPASFMIRMLASLNHIRAGRLNLPWL